MIVYAIKQLSTGWYFPYRQKEGESLTKKPTHIEFRPGAAPRIFLTRTHAENSLRFWLRGPLVNEWKEFQTGDGEVDSYTIQVKRPGSPERNKTDYAVVELNLYETDSPPVLVDPNKYR